MKNTVTEKITTATVPLDPWGDCLWCAKDPGSILCCKGDHPDRYAAERDYRRAPILFLGFPPGTPQPGLAIGRADIGHPRNTIGGAR